MSNLPAIPTAQEFQTMKELGQMAIKSGFLPASIKTAEQAVVIILKGRELGIPPMQAFSGINVIQGKPAVSPELMTGLIFKNVPGAVINFIKTDNAECVIEAKRPGGKFNRFSFSIEDAKRANLLGKGNWQTFPAAMLRARCLSAMARALFPDAIAGCSYTPEELGAETDDEGNVVSLPPEQPPKEEPRDVTPQEIKSKSATIQPGDHVINFGTTEKGYRGMTIRQAIERDGQAKVQLYINRLIENCEREKKSIPWMYAEMRDRLAEFVHCDQAPDSDWQNEDFDTAYDAAKAAR